MKIGFAKSDISPLIDFNIAFDSLVLDSGKKNNYDREIKFDIADRLKGMWRPENGGTRKIVFPNYISAMYGEDSNGPWVLLTFDLCEYTFRQIDEVKKPIATACGIKEDRIIIHFTHAHISVKIDKNKQEELLVKTVKQAKKNAVEAEYASLNLEIDASRYVINRRIHIDGLGTKTIMFNDFCEVKEDHLDATDQMKEWIKNFGADPKDFINNGDRITTPRNVDNQLQALFFRALDTKEILGSFTRFACHSVIVSEKKANGDISADYPGYLKKRIEDKIGGISLFGQGPSGDLRPLNKEYSHEFARKFGEKIGDYVVNQFNSITWEKLESSEFFSEPLNIPIRKDLPRSAKEAEENMIRIEKEYDAETNPEKKRKLQNLFWVNYRGLGTLLLLRPEWQEKGEIASSLIALKFNNSVLLFNSGEIFLHTKERMIEKFKDKNPITLTLTNEYISYIPARDDFEKGGYEPSVCLAVPGSDDLYVESANKLLTKVYSS